MKYKIKRFFKLIISTFISKKLLISIIIFLLILLIANNVFATSFPFTYNGFTFNTNDENFFDGLEQLTEFQNGWYYFVRCTTNSNIQDVYFLNSAETTNFRSFVAFNFNPQTTVTLVNESDTAFHYVGYTYNLTTHQFSLNEQGVISNGQSVVYSYAGNNKTLYFNTNSTYYTDSTLTNILYTPNVPIIPVFPYILDTDQNLTTLNIQYITIDSGDQNLTDLTFSIYTYVLGNPNNATEIYRTHLNSSSPFYNSGGANNDYYEIPTSLFEDKLNDGYVVVYRLDYVTSVTQGVEERQVIYTPDLNNLTDTEQIQNTIQNNTNRIINQFSSSITQQTNTLVTQITGVSNKLHELLQQNIQNGNIQADTNNFLKDQNFNNSNLNLPTSSQQDITQDGLNNIFLMIYNAFTSGDPVDIIVPVPFTDKSFTIPANYLKNVLAGSEFSFISNLIEVFWWYVISVFIIKDIANKMNKIKSGNVENLENSNIKEDML